MPEWLVAFISKLKPSAITSCGVILFCSLLLFMPNDLVVFLGLQEFIKEHRSWIGIAWLVSTSFCTVYLFKIISPLVAKLTKSYRLKRIFTKAIRNLTSDQKALLRSFKDNGWREQRHDPHSAIIDELTKLRILIIPEGQITFAMNPTCLCYVSYWAREYLNSHPKCLFLPNHIRKHTKIS